MDVYEHNQRAWDHLCDKGNRWTTPVDHEVIASAREGQWEVVLTPRRVVPREWFPNLRGCDVLGLASAGGQQGPILAAAGARVTVFDASEKQLEQDRRVAARENLPLRTVQGDMRDLAVFEDESFDLVFHPCSNSYTSDVRSVWREVHRVL